MRKIVLSCLVLCVCGGAWSWASGMQADVIVWVVLGSAFGALHLASKDLEAYL